MRYWIKETAEKLVRRTETRDPFRIAWELGVEVILESDYKKLKGMYAVVKRQRFIFINANLPKRKQRIVCAHELGHDMLHRRLAQNGMLQEFVMYDMTGRPEYEANVFAAHLLLDEDDIFHYARDGYDTHQIASMMNTDVNLMLIKMNRDGYQLKLMYTPRGDFLGRD